MGRTVWYPGHMAKGRRQLASLAGVLDLLIEVRDARAPRLTSSPSLVSMSKGLTVWTVLSKADLADETATASWVEAIGGKVWALDLRSPSQKVLGAMRRAIAALSPSSSSGKKYREVRFAVAGTPNVGKSMLLNRLVGRHAAVVGGIPGVTKGVSWFHGEGFLAADSPGILDPREDARAHRMLSWIQSTKGSVIGNYEDLARECITFLQPRGLDAMIKKSWGIEASGSSDEVLDRVGRRLGKLSRGGEVDAEAAGRAFIEALSNGRIGRLTLERPDDPPSWEELS